LRCTAKLAHTNHTTPRPLVSEGNSNLKVQMVLVVVTVSLADHMCR
jgi:hypothetical protein